MNIEQAAKELVKKLNDEAHYDFCCECCNPSKRTGAEVITEALKTLEAEKDAKLEEMSMIHKQCLLRDEAEIERLRGEIGEMMKNFSWQRCTKELDAVNAENKALRNKLGEGLDAMNYKWKDSHKIIEAELKSQNARLLDALRKIKSEYDENNTLAGKVASKALQQLSNQGDGK